MAPPWCTLLRASRPSVGRRVQLPSSGQECLELAWRSLFDAMGDAPTLRMWLAPGLELDERYYEALRDSDAPPDALHFTWCDEEYLQGPHGTTYVAQQKDEARAKSQADVVEDVKVQEEEEDVDVGGAHVQQERDEETKRMVQAQIYEGRDLQARLLDMEEALATTCDRLRRVQDDRRKKRREKETKRHVVPNPKQPAAQHPEAQQPDEEVREEEQTWGKEEMAHARRVRQIVQHGLKVPQ
uniref:Uncharacterized protein n=1 Tax=Picocystis salinarum TaxID=88271 RepID=A0A7S3UGM2_9CHLO